MKPEIQKSQAQEKRIAKRVGGTVNPGSGSGWRKRHDVRDDLRLWEMKRTDGKSITIKLVDLRAVEQRAALESRNPVMHLEFGSRRYILLPEGDYLDLIEAEYERYGRGDGLPG